MIQSSNTLLPETRMFFLSLSLSGSTIKLSTLLEENARDGSSQLCSLVWDSPGCGWGQSLRRRPDDGESQLTMPSFLTVS